MLNVFPGSIFIEPESIGLLMRGRRPISRFEPVNVPAFFADQAKRGLASPFKIEETRRLRMKLSRCLEELVVPAHRAREISIQDLMGFSFGF